MSKDKRKLRIKRIKMGKAQKCLGGSRRPKKFEEIKKILLMDAARFSLK